jgi:hypothetical protein
VSRGRLLEICPGPINPCRILLRGSDLQQALEESLLEEFKAKPIRGLGFRGEVLGVLCLDGMTVEYDASRPPLQRIVAAAIGGQPLEADREYLVGTIDMFTFGAGYLSLKNGKQVEYLLPEFLRDILAAELRNEAAVQASTETRHWIERNK